MNNTNKGQDRKRMRVPCSFRIVTNCSIRAVYYTCIEKNYRIIIGRKQWTIFSTTPLENQMQVADITNNKLTVANLGATHDCDT